MDLIRHISLASAVLIFTVPAFAAQLSPTQTGADKSGPQASTVQNDTNTTAGYAGEIFGVKVPAQNYYFVKAGVSVFGNRWGAPVKTAQDLENATWDQLVLSLVAFNENITVPQADVDNEVSKTLAAEGVKFDWKVDKDAYAAWVKQKTALPAHLFAEEMRHMMQLEKLREKVLASLNPQVTQDEARQKFLNEHNSLSVELAQFTDEKDAEAFYKKVKNTAALWEKERKKRPQDFKRPGFVSLEFLIDLWKVPSEACYAMMKKETGDFYPPRAIYKGYAVARILEKRPADEALFTGSEKEYIEKTRIIKKINGLSVWFDQLKEQAKITVYPAVFPETVDARAKSRG